MLPTVTMAPLPEFLGQGLQCRGVARHQHQPGATAGRGAGRGKANAAAGAGNDHDLLRKGFE
jgi:hypothetical protein